MSQPKPVVLISPDGEETEATDPVAINNLIYGAGYKPKDTTVAEVTPTAPTRTGRK